MIGPSLPAAVDLNRAKLDELAAHPFIGKALAAKLIRLRRRTRIDTPEDLLHAGVVNPAHMQRLSAHAFGAAKLRPLMCGISFEGPRLYVDEPFALRFEWLRPSAAPAAILSLSLRFPSGRVAELDTRLEPKEIEAGELSIPGFVSGESGDLYVLATLRDAAGGVSRQSVRFGVFTRNPVQIFVSPQFLTQSGRAGAPRYNFAEGRWYCNSDVRWVNGEARAVNLGRRVEVSVSDAGAGVIETFSFNLSGDVVVPAFSTVYGNWFHWHSGGPSFDVFSAKGDVTIRYAMSGSGFSPQRSQIWRTMRTVGFNLIRVGDFTSVERSEYQRAAAQIASGIYQSRDMTVYGTELYRIEGTADMDADKARWRFIDNDAEFDAMAAKYSVPNWYMDVFMVENYWGGFGASYVSAPVDKSGTRSGIVIGRDGDTVNLGQTFAHEGGHHLGLEHADENDGCADTDPTSATISNNFIFSASRRDSAEITGCQINKMRTHGFVRSMTP
jgi:hypothetical protein